MERTFPFYRWVLLWEKTVTPECSVRTMTGSAPCGSVGTQLRAAVVRTRRQRRCREGICREGQLPAPWGHALSSTLVFRCRKMVGCQTGNTPSSSKRKKITMKYVAVQHRKRQSWDQKHFCFQETKILHLFLQNVILPLGGFGKEAVPPGPVPSCRVISYSQPGAEGSFENLFVGTLISFAQERILVKPPGNLLGSLPGGKSRLRWALLCEDPSVR